MPDTYYPDIERLARLWLADHTGKPVFTETSTQLEASLPAFKLEVYGGADGPTRTDRTVTIELDAFDTTRGGALALAAEGDKAMRALAANGTASWYVDDVELRFHPSIEPYPNASLRRASATYSLTLRPR